MKKDRQKNQGSQGENVPVPPVGAPLGGNGSSAVPGDESGAGKAPDPAASSDGKQKPAGSDGKGQRPAYYYSRSAIPYYSLSSHGSGPAYYYGSSGGSGGPGYYYGGNQSGYYYGNSDNPHDQEDSIFGRISLYRAIRVTLMKWPTLVVAVVLGLAAGFAYYKASPVTYKATCLIEISIKPPKVMSTQDVIINDPNAQGTTQEIFNTRLAMFRSSKVIKLVADRIRTDYSQLKTLPDEDLFDLLRDNVTLTQERQSRLVTISVRYTDAKIAKAIADAYAQTAVAFSQDENKEAVEAGVARLVSMKESAERAVSDASQKMLEFRQKNQLDPMVSERESLNQVRAKLSMDLTTLVAVRNDDKAILDILDETLKAQDRSKFSSLPDRTPRAEEIARVQKELQDAIAERDALLVTYTEKNQKVEIANRGIEVLEKQYFDAVERARNVAAAAFEISDAKVKEMNNRIQENFSHQQELSAKIARIETQLRQLELTYENSSLSLKDVSANLENARISINDSLATVRIIGDGADLPKAPFSPKASVDFSVGALVGFVIGFFFILALDRVEDRITSSEDIRRHMNTTVLSLVPRIPRTKRTQLALLSATKKFSRIAEAFAGLRSLLESPRYSNVSRVILVVSTQPEEGKTITASNLALSFAMAGKKTLLVDFDLRRPRVARIYDVVDQIVSENNLIEILDNPEETGYDGVAIPSGFDNLDLVVSSVSSNISPANVIGSEKLRTFFDWARVNYEHVVIDSPPFGLVSDAIQLGSFSDSVMIVCRPNKSRFGLVRNAIAALKESGSNVIGVVVNEVNFNQANAFTSGTYNSYSNYSKYGKYGGRYGYGYGSYYKRAAKDDITAVKTHARDESEANDSPDSRPDETQKAKADELEVDDEE